MDSIQPQPIKVVLRKPVKCVVDKEIAHHAAVWTVEVDRLAPRRLVPVGKELRRVSTQIIPFWAKVVVDHVQKNHQPFAVSRLNQPLQVIRPAILAIRSKEQNTVVTPVPFTRKVSDRHQFHRSEAEFRKVVETILHRCKCPFRSKGPHVNLINDRLFPGPPAPLLILPLETGCIDHLARALYILWLKSGSWIRNFWSAVDLEFVAHSGTGLIGNQLKPAGYPLHRQRASTLRLTHAEAHFSRFWCPEPKSHSAVRKTLCPERHCVQPPHKPFLLSFAWCSISKASERPFSG